MKTKLLFFVALFALLFMSTWALADGRPTGLRIGRLVSGGGTNVEVDVTVTNTDLYYGSFDTTVWLGAYLPIQNARQYVDNNFSTWFPYALDWGDGYSIRDFRLSGPSGGPWTGTFSHTYTQPGTYTVTVGDVVCCGRSPTVYSGNAITANTRYIWTFTGGSNQSFYYTSPVIIAITANDTVTTGTGIPALNIYGLLAMAFVLVGAGLLVFRRPQNSAF